MVLSIYSQSTKYPMEKQGANVSFLFIVVLKNHRIAKDSIHMVNWDSSQLKKNLQNTLMVVMYIAEIFF